MAREFALKGVIQFFDQKASETIMEVDNRLQNLRKSAERVSKGAVDISKGLLTLGAGGLIIGAGFKGAIDEAMRLEQQIAKTNAKFGGLDDAGIEAITAQIKDLGAKTEFTAVQAGEGMEFLALAGLNASESIEVLPTILDTAAAGAMGLKEASDIVTDSMSALGGAFDANMPKSERAIMLADKMALVQSKANTNIFQLGEAVKYGGGILTGFGVPLDQSIAALGKLADAGLKGSTGGTNIGAMFNKLVKPTAKASKFLGKFGLSVKNLPLQDIGKLTDKLKGVLGTITNQNERGQMAVELFGRIGIKAYNALANAGGKSIGELAKKIEGAGGSASKMAEIQRATFKGMTLQFQSAVSALQTEIGLLFIQGERTILPILKTIVTTVQGMAQGFAIASSSIENQRMQLEKAAPELKKYIEFAIGFKKGLVEAFDTAKSAFKSFFKVFRSFLPAGSESAEVLGKMVAKFAVLSAMIAPLLVGLVGFGFAFTQIAGIFTGLISIAGGLSTGIISLVGIITSSLGGPVIVGIFAALAIAATTLGDDWDALGQRAGVIWDGIKEKLINVPKQITEMVTPLWENLKERMIGSLGGTGEKIAGVIESIGGVMKKSWEILTSNLFAGVDIFSALFNGKWDEAGASAGVALGKMFVALKDIALGGWDIISVGFEKIKNGVIEFFKDNTINKVKDFFSDFAGMFDGTTKDGFFGNLASSFRNEVTMAENEAEEPTVKIAQPNKAKTAMQVERVNEARAENVGAKNLKLVPPLPNTQANNQPIEATINVSAQIDGQEVGRAVAKQQINNSERLGQPLNPKERTRLENNGTFAKEAG